MNSKFETLRTKHQAKVAMPRTVHPESWKPEAGDELSGTFVKWDEATFNGKEGRQTARIAVLGRLINYGSP